MGLDKSLPIYSKIDKKIKDQIAKYEQFLFFKKNVQYKGCTKLNCEQGYFNKNSNNQKCIRCKTDHCKSCYQLKHNGKCEVKDE